MPIPKLLALLATLPAVTLVSLPASVEPEDIFDHTYALSAEQIRAYWTPERLAHIEDKGDVPLKPVGDDPLNSDGDAWPGTGAFPPGVGRLFIVSAKGLDTSCTATVVSAAQPDIIVTAAHCAHGPADGLTSHLLFVPAFHQGQAPLGVFPVKRLVMVMKDGAADPDVAFMQLHPDPQGRAVADIAGAQHLAFNAAPSAAPRVALGYPVSANGIGLIPPPPPYEFGNPEYSGQVLAYCASARTEALQCLGFDGRPAGWGLTCVQGPGSSGGPQMIGFDMDNGQGMIIGVHSHGVVTHGRATNCAAGLDDAAQRAFERIQRR